ncbi:hypothetical protein FACS189437_00020 [Bacteroidia bacterium]|nr:hypothetical protein FACS189437_00020 [Bacteroidia bacterium]
MPKVSIIIPIYNVEKYLRECLDSVLRQALKDIEIILVDDGSPDNSPSICDEYAQSDNRIKVIHQKNQGLSVARNQGLMVANGEYIGYVDSDDVISDFMFEQLYNYADGADIVECEVTQDINRLQNKNMFPKITAYTTNILYHYLYKNKVGVWCRIYNRELLQELQFESGAFSEDVLWSYQVFCKCRKYVIINSILYFWRPQLVSLSRNSVQYLNAQGYRVAKLVKIEHPEAYPAIELQLIIIKINLLNNAAVYGFANKDVQEEFEIHKNEYISFVRANFSKILFSSFFRWQTKLKALVISFGYNYYHTIIKAIK